MITTLLILGAAGGIAIVASIVMTWASRRSAIWSMLLGGVLAVVALIGALIIALLLTRAAFPE